MEIPWNFFDDLLPPEVTTEIFAYFSLEDVVYVSLVCKNWNVYFDTKEIWKRIFFQHFSYIDKSRLDINRITRWRRLCINSINAKKWARNYNKTVTTCYYQFAMPNYQEPNIRINFLTPKQHFIMSRQIISAVDIKMAGKLVPVKANPVKYFSALQYDTSVRSPYMRNECNNFSAEFKLKLRDYDPTANKEDSYKIPTDLGMIMSNRIFAAYDENGRIVTDIGPKKFLIWDHATHNTTTKMPSRVSVILLPGPAQFGLELSYIDSLNSRYAGWLSAHDATYGLIDLNKHCAHHQKLINKTTSWELEIQDLTKPCRPESCACIIIQGRCLQTFASHLDPSLVVFFEASKIVVWKSGKLLKEIPYVLDKNKSLTVPSTWMQNYHKPNMPTPVSEYVTNVNGVARHWVQYFTCFSDICIFELNGTAETIFIPKIDNFQWVPKEMFNSFTNHFPDKAILVSDSKMIVYDLDTKSWAVKMTLQRKIKALTFNSTGNILFVADDHEVYMIYWRAGAVLGSIDIELQKVSHLLLALDQVLIVTADNYVLYKKLLYPCTL